MKTSIINPTGMYFKVVIMTPEMAASILETNERNRTPNRDKLAKLVYDIKQGHFELTHQAIALDVNGKLIDGQHRLKAVVELTRDSRNHIEAVKEPFPYLIQHIWRPKDRNRMQKVLDLEKRLIAQAAFYQMGCNTEPEAALVAWKGMRASMC